MPVISLTDRVAMAEKIAGFNGSFRSQQRYECLWRNHDDCVHCGLDDLGIAHRRDCLIAGVDALIDLGRTAINEILTLVFLTLMVKKEAELDEAIDYQDKSKMEVIQYNQSKGSATPTGHSLVFLLIAYGMTCMTTSVSILVPVFELSRVIVFRVRLDS